MSLLALLLALLSFASLANAQQCAGDTIASARSCRAEPEPDGDYSCDCEGSVLNVAYGSTIIGCSAPLAVKQAQTPPVITYSADNAKLYTLLLVNTDRSIPVAPILHFGAVNVPGADLLQGYDASSASFNAYRGPDPPAFFTDSYRNWFTYVWVLLEQTGSLSEPNVPSNVFFDIEAFRLGLGLPTPVASAAFISGFCVHPEATWCPAMPVLGPLCNFARGPSGCF